MFHFNNKWNYLSILFIIAFTLLTSSFFSLNDGKSEIKLITEDLVDEFMLSPKHDKLLIVKKIIK